MTTPVNASYKEWIPRWISHIGQADDPIRVPSAATAVTASLVTRNWISLLANYPNKKLTSFFTTGLSQGFQIGYRPQQPLKSAKCNLACALEHPEVVDQYLTEELAHNRVASPFHIAWTPYMRISRFGVIPKHHQPNKWRFIIDLSHPADHSVNDGIPKSLCTLSYITIDTTIGNILELEQGSLLAKIDIKHAFRLLLVHPVDHHLLAMCWRNQIFVDTCLPFCMRSAPKLFNILADLLSRILEQHGVTRLLHYLDDFLLMGPPQSPICQSNLLTVKHVCSLHGIPLALEKVEGPSDSLTFLGIILDTQRMEARLPAERSNASRHLFQHGFKRRLPSVKYYHL